MILFSSIINAFEHDFMDRYRGRLLPSHLKALGALQVCRTEAAPRMLASCTDCDYQTYVPHSCGHRLCPHCQNHECQQWLARQLKKQLPVDYYLLTFTLPAELRSLAWQHQRILYDLLIRSAWETVRRFSENDKKLQGTPGAIAVLHTHSRRLDYHPHVHLVIPAGAVDAAHRLWRTKSGNGKKRYLFNHKALAKVFRANMLDGIVNAGLGLPAHYPDQWVVDCKSVGRGDKALIYLGRYLYKGVIQEKDIVACEKGQVTFRYRDSRTRQFKYRTLSGARFLWLILRHALPRGFRRARNFGFLHPNSKRLIQLLQRLLKFDPQRTVALMTKRPAMRCACCGAKMAILKTRLPPLFTRRVPVPA
jgi:hypothetical protein